MNSHNTTEYGPNQILPTGTSDAPVSGYWIDEGGSPGCDPQTESCHFRPSGSNDRVTCSLVGNSIGTLSLADTLQLKGDSSHW